jgi:hypothetical protein
MREWVAQVRAARRQEEQHGHRLAGDATEGNRRFGYHLRMTKSREDRLASIDEAILLLMDNLHGRSIMEVFIDERFMDDRILSTTWDELKDRYFVRETNSRYTYTLSGLGWIIGLKLRGDFETDALKGMAGALCAALKDRVKGRQDDAMVQVAELAVETGIPEAFIRNAVEADLFYELFGTKGAAWASFEDRRRFILIPRGFGMQLL